MHLCVELLFNDNKRQEVNVGEFIHRHPYSQYNKYLDQLEFEKISLDDGNIVWGEDWDLIFPIEGSLLWYNCLAKIATSLGPWRECRCILIHCVDK